MKEKKHTDSAKNTLKHITKWRYLSLVFLWFITANMQAQEIDFTAKASKTELGVNQRLRVEFTVNKKGTKNFTPPSFAGFTVVAGPSSSVSQAWVNGISSYSKTYTYILQPKTQGTFTIEPAKLTYKGKEYTSNTLEIKVTKAIEQPKDPNDPEYIAGDEVFLVAHISNERPFVGEGIYVEYRLYFSGRIRLLDADFGDMPKYEGFWNQEIDVRQEEKTGPYKGKQFHYYTLKKSILIPQKSGKLIVEPVSMDLLLAIPTGKYDFFGTPMMRRIRKHYTSGKRSIQVKPLPISDKPAHFTGAVGQYELSVTPDKTRLKTNDATQIEVQIKGKGNLKLFEMPQLNVPDELELYEPEHREKIYTTSSGMKGSITDTYSLVPSYAGKYKIPPVNFSYFDPEDEKYHTLTSQEIILDVEEGSAMPNTHMPIRQQVQTTGEVFRFINTKTKLTVLNSYKFFDSPLYFLILLMSLLAIPVGVLLGKRRKRILSDKEGLKAKQMDKMSRQYLEEAEHKLDDKEAFYVALEKALHLFLKSKLRIETSQMSKENIRTMLKEKNMSDYTVNTLLDLLNQCEIVRYAPGSHTDAQRDINKAKEWMKRFNQEFKS